MSSLFVTVEMKFLWESAGLEEVVLVGGVSVPLPSSPLARPPPASRHQALHSVRRMMWIPDSVNTGPLISPALSAKEASSKGFCI